MSYIGDNRVAKRYAGALFRAASKLGVSEGVAGDLEAVVNAWRQTPALAAAIQSPLVPGDRKHAVVDAVFADCSELVRSFLHLLVRKRREWLIISVREEYGSLADVAAGVARAVATVATPISDGRREALRQALSRRIGKDVVLEVVVDPAVIGGAMVRLNDNVIDGTVRGTLERLLDTIRA